MNPNVRIVMRPLDGGWSDPITQFRKPSPFKAGWSNTREKLCAEIDMLTDYQTECVIQVDVDPGDFRLDGGFRSGYRVNSPRVIVSFESRHGPLRYACDTYEESSRPQTSWQVNVRAVALSLNALRAVTRWGMGGRGEQYTGWAAIGTGRPMGPATMTVEEARRLLLDVAGLSVVSPLAADFDWQYVYRLAAKATHPDTGGDAELFKRVTEARDLIGAS